VMACPSNYSTFSVSIIGTPGLVFGVMVTPPISSTYAQASVRVALSSTLFIYATDWIRKSGLQAYSGITFGTDHQFTDLDYADDIAIIGADFLHIQAALDSNNTIAQRVGMKINEAKTKVLT